jgi:hypothetical protein
MAVQRLAEQPRKLPIPLHLPPGDRVRTTRLLRFSLLILLLSTVAGCPASRAVSRPEGEDRAHRDALAPPISALLGQRDRLSLTSAQVVALDSIHQEWAARDGRLTRRGGSVISAGAGGTSVAPARVASSTPEARANHLRSAHAVQSVLNREQQLAVCEMYRNARTDVSRLWPWCGG